MCCGVQLILTCYTLLLDVQALLNAPLSTNEESLVSSYGGKTRHSRQPLSIRGWPDVSGALHPILHLVANDMSQKLHMPLICENTEMYRDDANAAFKSICGIMMPCATPMRLCETNTTITSSCEQLAKQPASPCSPATSLQTLGR